MGTGGLGGDPEAVDEVVVPGVAHDGPLSAPHAEGMFDKMHQTGGPSRSEGKEDDLEDPPMTGDPVHVFRLTERELAECVIYGMCKKDVPMSSLTPERQDFVYRIVHRLMKRASLDSL